MAIAERIGHLYLPHAVGLIFHAGTRAVVGLCGKLPMVFADVRHLDADASAGRRVAMVFREMQDAGVAAKHDRLQDKEGF